MSYHNYACWAEGFPLEDFCKKFGLEMVNREIVSDYVFDGDEYKDNTNETDQIEKLEAILAKLTELFDDRWALDVVDIDADCYTDDVYQGMPYVHFDNSDLYAMTDFAVHVAKTMGMPHELMQRMEWTTGG